MLRLQLLKFGFLLIVITANLGLVVSQETQRPGTSSETTSNSGQIEHGLLASSGSLSANINQARINYHMQVNRTTISDRSNIYPESHIVSFSYRIDAPTYLSRRPVIFVFNGGPGSAALWLHMGAWGPMRIMMPGAPSDLSEPPYERAANPGFLIDSADLVFVDPVDTGLSQVVHDGDASRFYDLRRDARSMCQFVKNWIVAEGREGAPIFLAGESYGSLRVTGIYTHPVCRRLKPDIEGLILVSGMLDLRSRPSQLNNGPLTEMGRFPTLASLAWYHNLVDRDLWKNHFEEFLAEAIEVAVTDIGTGVLQWRYLSLTDRHSIAEKMERLLGFPILDVDVSAFPDLNRLFELHHARILDGTTSLYDGRYLRASNRRRGTSPSPPLTFDELSQIYHAHLKAHVEAMTGFDITNEYVALNSEISRNWTYDFNKSLDMGQGTNMAENLAQALNSKLVSSDFRVFSASGVHDKATPFFAVEFALEQAGLPADILYFHRYEGGHMMYLNSDIARQLSNDIRRFVRLE